MAIVEPRHARGGTLVLGGGFAGSYVARLLGKRGATIVSEENFMLYTPMLPEAASGSLEPRHVVVPLRMMCPHSELLLGRLTALDPKQRVATIQTGAGTIDVHYEQAVLALGSFPRALPIPGLAEHGLGFKDLADAIHLRNHVLRRLEAAAAENDRQRAEAHLTFVFVGAGYAGVEALAELVGPRPRRAALLPAVPASATALGARRRGAEDPARDPDAPRRVRGEAARRSAASRSTRRRRSRRPARARSRSRAD